MHKATKGLFGILLIAVLAFPLWNVAPAFAWGPADRVYEHAGPRVDFMETVHIEDVSIMYQKLKAGEIDVMAWDLLPADLADALADPNIEVAGYSDIGMREVDINNQKWPTGVAGFYDDTNPIHRMARNFRRAIAELVDKDGIITDIVEGLGQRMDTVVPPALGGWVNKDVSAYDPGTGAWLGNYPYEYDPVDPYSDAIYWLSQDEDGDGLADWRDTDGDGWINDPLNPTANLAPLDFYLRTDDVQRHEAGTWLANEMEALQAYGFGIPVNRFDRTIGGVIFPVFVYHDYSLYTGGWGLSADPDFIHDLYHSRYDRAWLANYVGVRDEYLDGVLEDIKYAETLDEAAPAVQEAQRYMVEQATMIPIWAGLGYKAYRSEWEGIVNGDGVGLDTGWTFMNARKRGTTGGGIIKEGVKGVPNMLNPVTSQWYYEFAVIGMIYDTLLGGNPYDISEDKPAIAIDWDIGTYWDSATASWNTKIVFKLDPNAKWHDDPRTPEYDPHTLNASDVKFSFEYHKAQQGWFWSSVYNVVEVNILGEYEIEVKFNVKSVWALHWVGFVPIIPKYIWESVTDALAYQPQDQDTLIGSGPFTWKKADNGATWQEYNKMGANGDYIFKDLGRAGKDVAYPEFLAPGYDFVIDVPVTNYDPVNSMDYTVTVDETGNFNGSVTESGTLPPGGSMSVRLPQTPNQTDPPPAPAPGNASKFTVTITVTVTATWTWVEDSTTLTLTITRTWSIIIDPYIKIEGDINGDDIVDVFDATVLSLHYGHTPPDRQTHTGAGYTWDMSKCMSADINADGTIDTFDAIKLSTAFGNSI